MAEVEITGDVEIPPKMRGSPRGPKKWKAIKDLEVGKAAIFKYDSEEEMVRNRNTISTTAHRYSRRLKREYTVRTLDPEHGFWRVGVWRLA